MQLASFYSVGHRIRERNFIKSGSKLPKRRKITTVGYPGGYCTVPVGTAAVPVLWVLQMGTAGYCGYCGYCAVPAVPVGTAGYCGYCGYCTG